MSINIFKFLNYPLVHWHSFRTFYIHHNIYINFLHLQLFCLLTKFFHTTHISRFHSSNTKMLEQLLRNLHSVDILITTRLNKIKTIKRKSHLAGNNLLVVENITIKNCWRGEDINILR